MLKETPNSLGANENVHTPSTHKPVDWSNPLYIAPQANMYELESTNKDNFISRNFKKLNISIKNCISKLDSPTCSVFNEQQSIRKAAKAGYQAAKMGLTPLTIQQQMRKGFTKDQSNAYIEAYERFVGCPATQMKRRVELAGYQAAKYGSKRPSLSKLYKRGYTPSLIEIYYKAYDRTAGTPFVQQKRKAYRMVFQVLNNNLKMPSEALLIKRGFDKDAIKYFYKVFKEKCDSKRKN